jgi:hypothetical protein
MLSEQRQLLDENKIKKQQTMALVWVVCGRLFTNVYKLNE